MTGRPEVLSCGCDPSLARPHPADCSGRRELRFGHFWSEEEIALGWHLRPVVAGRLWPNVLFAHMLEEPTECGCTFCALKRGLGQHEPPSRCE